MLRNLLSPIPSGVGVGLQVFGSPLWGLLGSEILAATSSGEQGPGLAVNDGLTPALRYVYLLDTRSVSGVVLYPDSSHEGPVPYSGTIRLYEEGTGEVAATLAARSFSVTAGVAAVAPTITSQPQPQTVQEGGNAAFTVAASGTAPLAYQWRRNGLAISGATASSYTLTGATLADSGAVFSVVVSNAAGSATSTGAALTVTAAAVAPTISVQPQPQTVQEGGNAAFTVVASGTAPLAYQWRRNGLAISGATASSYTLVGATLADSGAVFSVVVSNAAGSVTSAGVTLTVNTQSGGVTLAALDCSLAYSSSEGVVTLGGGGYSGGGGGVIVSPPRRHFVQPGRVRFQVLSPKSPAEIVPVLFSFSGLAPGLHSPVISVVRLSGGGADPDPGAMVRESPPSIEGGVVVRQMVSGGVLGVDYLLSCQVDAPDGSRFVLSGVLPVRLT